MNGPGNYKQAQNLLRNAAVAVDSDMELANTLIAAAAVHAKLAEVAAIVECDSSKHGVEWFTIFRGR